MLMIMINRSDTPRGVYLAVEVGVVVGVFWERLGDAVFGTHPFEVVVVSAHEIVEHVSSFLDDLGQGSACFEILGESLDIRHQRNNLFAHNRTYMFNSSYTVWPHCHSLSDSSGTS